MKLLLFVLKSMPEMFKGLFASDRAVRDYEALFDRDLAGCRELARSDMPFDEMADEFADRFGVQIASLAGVMIPPMLARRRLAKLFEDDAEATDLLVAADMELPGNPTADMGRRMFELASFDEFQATADGAEFETRIRERAYPDAFLAAFDDYLERFGCRCIREIDVGTPRFYEHLPGFFEQLQAIDIANDTLRTTEQRRIAAHERLLEIARARGKEKRVAKDLNTIRSMAGYREAPKYFFVYTVDLLRRHALVLGRRFVDAGRPAMIAIATGPYPVGIRSGSRRIAAVGFRRCSACGAYGLASRSQHAAIADWLSSNRAATAAQAVGAGVILNVASAITASVPNEPVYKRFRS